jgi:hypothetical protein
VGVTGLEPVTSSLSSNELPSAGETGNGFTATPSPVCTRVCTREAENANAGSHGTDQGSVGEGTDQRDPLAKLAAAIAGLSASERERLAGMLAGHR